jgi:hypothetical protein
MSVQHANIGVVKKDLQLYYNREFVKSFRGEATTNTCNLNSRYDYVWANAVVTRDTTAPVAPPITGFEIAKLRSTDGQDAQTILYTASVDQVNGGTYTHSAYIYLESGTYVKVGQHWNPWDYGVPNYITKNKWTRVSYTVTNTPNNYGNVACAYNTDGTIYVTATQYEKKSYSTPFVNGSRSANTIAGGGGLLDISGNNYNIDLNGANVLFDSGGYYFNGNTAGPYINAVSNSTLDSLSNNTHTYEVWFKLLGTPSGLYDGYFFGRSGYHEGFVHLKSSSNVIYVITWYFDNTNGALGTTLSLNTWYHGVYVANVETATRQLYINGSLVDSNTLTKQLRQYTSAYYIGAASVDYASNSIVSSARAYNRALTAAEVLQNFNATRKTYGI